MPQKIWWTIHNRTHQTKQLQDPNLHTANNLSTICYNPYKTSPNRIEWPTFTHTVKTWWRTPSHRKHSLLDDQTTMDLPNDPWYTTTCQCISADCITHGDKTRSNHLPWGHNPVIYSVLLNISCGTHDKQHVGFLLCLLSSTWIHSKSSFLIELHGPVWMQWSSNPSRHLPPLLPEYKFELGERQMIVNKKA